VTTMRATPTIIEPGYGRAAIFGRHALGIDLTDEVAYAHLLEHGDDLDLNRDEQERILQNVENGRTDPWNP
jgi:hypothetical protein